MPPNPRNLIPVHEWECPFTDAFAQFSLGFSDHNLGPNFLHPKAAIASYEMCSPLLQLWQRREGACHIIRRHALESLPWCVREEAELFVGAQRIEIRTESLFRDARRAQIRITLRNPGERAVTPELFWAGCLRADRENRGALAPYTSARPGERRAIAEHCPGGLECGLDPNGRESDLPQLRFRLLSKQLQARLADGPPWGGGADREQGHFYELAPEQPLMLEAGSSTEFLIEIQFRGANAGEALCPWEDIDPVNGDEAFRHAESRWAEASGLRKLAPDQGHLLRARSGLLCDGVEGHNGEFGPWIASLCSFGTQDFSCSFFWDSLFSSTALSRFHPEAARGAMATAFIRQHEFDGAAPERKWNYSCPQHSLIGCPQSPIGSWALNQYLRANDGETDRAFARDLLPRLRANHLFWQNHSDADGDALSEYNWSGQIGDNSQMWDRVAMSGPDGDSGCFWLPPVASVTCNSFLYRDARELAKLCGSLGLNEEQQHWRQRAERIAATMQKWLWVETEQAYLDYNHRTREHHRIETFFQFLPLWAELPMPREAKRRLIEDKLLDPEQYFGAIPFPSAPYNSSEYDAGGYWRGRAWSHISCWILSALWREGYHQEADEGADRIIAWQERRDFRENMHSDPTVFDPKGFRYYNWGCAATLYLQERIYRLEHSLDSDAL